jgi:hypothetical protein
MKYNMKRTGLLDDKIIAEIQEIFPDEKIEVRGRKKKRTYLNEVLVCTSAESQEVISSSLFTQAQEAVKYCVVEEIRKVIEKRGKK